MSAKGGQKEGFPGQRPKSRAKEGHDRAPSQKQGSLAAMVPGYHGNVYQITMVTFTRLPWLRVPGYHGYVYQVTMVTCTRLRVSGYHGYVYQVTMVTCIRLPWLRVSDYHGYVYQVTMVTCTRLPWLPGIYI